MIRLGNYNDLEQVMSITKDIVKEMKSAGNPQWHDNYPTKDDFSQDIKASFFYVYEENNKVVGFICIKKDIDNEYEHVPHSNKNTAYIMHRLGVDKNYRNLGIAKKFMKYAEELAIKDNVYLMKADTEINNIKMNSLFETLGYKKLATFNWSDNDGLFNYYEKELKNNK